MTTGIRLYVDKDMSIRAMPVVMTNDWVEALFQSTVLPEDPKEAERLLLRMREIIDRALVGLWNG